VFLIGGAPIGTLGAHRVSSLEDNIGSFSVSSYNLVRQGGAPVGNGSS